MAPMGSFLPSLAALSACIYGVAAQQRVVVETEVLILGGGMTGVSAAHSLYFDANITDFLIVEGRDELGGRVQNHRIGNYVATVAERLILT
jgi:heterodisulfide reductase subunit A-like polyferredoxin